jgi:murein DD-endopeptidase MepM/ murein hydrolase activator NlpD
MAQDLPASSFDLAYAVGAGSAFGPASQSATTVKQVGTGDVQISISWDVLSDTDLHVVDPTGAHIYFASKSSVSGGRLDLDSNPACAIDRINNENITWATNTAPIGQYSVYANLYASCGTATTTYTVTVTQRGKEPQVFFGTLSPPSTPLSIGKLVTTFTRTPVASQDRFTWPIDPTNQSNGFFAACNENPDCYWISSGGWRDVQPFLRHIYINDAGQTRYHLGADWNFGSEATNGDKGKPVYAAADGRVTEVLSAVKDWGNIIFIRHDTSFGTYTSMYAHVDWLDTGPPAKGASATRGVQIAKVGNGSNGGTTYPYHLHFEIRKGSGTDHGFGYVATQNTAPPQQQVDPNAFIASHR